MLLGGILIITDRMIIDCMLTTHNLSRMLCCHVHVRRYEVVVELGSVNINLEKNACQDQIARATGCGVIAGQTGI